MKLAGRIAILLYSILVVSISAALAAPADTIETVSAGISSEQASPPPRVAKRMENSVKTIGEQVLTGRNVADVENTKATYEKLIKEVFDRVLVGYSVNQVQLIPGHQTQILVNIMPWGDVIQEVSLDVDFGGVAPEFQPLLLKDMGNLSGMVNDALVGLPIDAADWAGGVTKNLIKDILSDQLPEFRASVDIVAGPRTTVKLALLPVGPTIQNTAVSLHSGTIPNVLLLEGKPAIEEAVKPLQGLPVAFVERNRQYIEGKVKAIAAGHPMTERYGLTVTPVIMPGVDTQVSVDAETAKYKIWLEGYLDMGKAKDSTSAKLHIGQNIGKNDELFVETQFIPSTVSWQFSPGWGHKLGSSTATGLKYNLTHKHGLLWLEQAVTPKWSLRLERTPDINYNELGLRYKIHEFISAEYVFTNEDKWLRLVGNL